MGGAAGGSPHSLPLSTSLGTPRKDRQTWGGYSHGSPHSLPLSLTLGTPRKDKQTRGGGAVGGSPHSLSLSLSLGIPRKDRRTWWGAAGGSPPLSPLSWSFGDPQSISSPPGRTDGHRRAQPVGHPPPPAPGSPQKRTDGHSWVQPGAGGSVYSRGGTSAHILRPWGWGGEERCHRGCCTPKIKQPPPKINPPSKLSICSPKIRDPSN